MFFPKSFLLGLEERLRRRIKRYGGRETDETGTGRRKEAPGGNTAGTETRVQAMRGQGRWRMSRRTEVGRRAERGRRRSDR